MSDAGQVAISLARPVFLAAGMSRRFGRSKVLESVGPHGECLLDYAITDSAAAGFGPPVIVTRRELLDELRQHVSDRHGEGADFVLQSTEGSREKPWGTGQAVCMARPFISGPFAVANADDWYGPEAWQALAGALSGVLSAAPTSAPTKGAADSGVLITYPAAVTLSESGGVSRGWVQLDSSGRVKSIVELTNLHHANEAPDRRDQRDQCDPFDQLEGIDPQGHHHLIGSDAPVSMNLWGLQERTLDLLTRDFDAFVNAGPQAHEEFALSTALDRLVQSGELRLNAIPAGRRWLGLTHPGDRDAVSAALRALV